MFVSVGTSLGSITLWIPQRYRRGATVIRIIYVILAVFWLGRPVVAADYTWINAAGGTFTSATNWNAGIAPTSTDNATINLGGTYTITLASSTTIQSLLLNNAAHVTLLVTAGFRSRIRRNSSVTVLRLWAQACMAQ